MAGDGGPFHPQNNWFFILFSLPSLNNTQEKIKGGF